MSDTTQAPTDAAALAEPNQSVCLICDLRQDQLPGGPLAPHPDPEDTSTTDPNRQPRECIGSGRLAAQYDGKDVVRRYGIRQHAVILGTIAGKRAEMAKDMEQGWKITDLITYHAEPLIRMEAMAARWFDLSVNGDYWATFDTALRYSRVDTQGSNLLDRAAEHHHARGNRAWIHAVRAELLRETRKLGDAQPILDKILLGF